MIFHRALCLAIAFAWLFVASEARAGAIAPCTEPFAYDAAVNVYVLEDWERNAESDLRDARKRLAWLVKLDTLFRDSYGSLGVHFLWQPEAERCTLDWLVERVSKKLPPRGAAAFVDQRVYREKNQILLQTYFRFLRVDAAKLVQPERVKFAPPNGQPTFSEFLPGQVVAFPPRRLMTTDLDTIERGFAEGSLLYSEPRADSPGRRLPLTSETAVPFLVTEALSGGWMRIDARLFGRSDLSGWLHADPAVSGRLRSLLPELEFLEGVVGYLSYLQASDGRILQRDATPGIVRQADDAFARYLKGARGVDDRGEAMPLTQTLRAAMVLTDSARANAVLADFIATVQRSLPDSRVRGLLGINRLAACCQQAAQNKRLRSAADVVGLSGALNDFQSALAIDPGNAAAVANLDAIYAMLWQLAAFPIAKNPPSDTDAHLREAYIRALARLPVTRDELRIRREEIRVLQRNFSRLESRH
jgi:hypothetical protein